MFKQKLFWFVALCLLCGGALADQIPTPSLPAKEMMVPKPSLPVPAPQIAATPTITPKAPELNVSAYVLMDASSGKVLAEKNPDQQLSPASLTKIMSLYLVADSLKTGKIKITDMVTISERAWRMEGSRMFAKVGSGVPLQQLIEGVAIASGNDATCAVAEHIGGSEEAFVDLMNRSALALGMQNTHFADSNGLPALNHHSSARDLALLSRAFINNFPEFYPWFKTKWINYNGIKQPNRNRLLWRDATVDGIKTGHTADAGYCLAASSVRNGMRLIAVVLNAPSDIARANDTETLLNYGFRFFESRKLFTANSPLVRSKVIYGKEKTTPMGLSSDFIVTVPFDTGKRVKIVVKMQPNLKAPIKKGDVCGEAIATLDGKTLETKPVIALQDNKEGGLWRKLCDKIGSFF